MFDEYDLIKRTSAGACFDESRKYRYSLWRRWRKQDIEENNRCSDLVAFIGLNPSTADETIEDPTVRRCIRYAKDWGFGGMVMLNAFAYRATDPREMKRQEKPIGVAPLGVDNDLALKYFAEQCPMIVVAWGNHGAYLKRSENVLQLLKGSPVYEFGRTKLDEPKHPLYLAADLKPKPFVYW